MNPPLTNKMDIRTRTLVFPSLLAAAYATDIDFFRQNDRQCSTYAYATCYGIQPGDCCLWSGNPNQGYFGSARVSNMYGSSAV
jgi:hypothetical protein